MSSADAETFFPRLSKMCERLLAVPRVPLNGKTVDELKGAFPTFKTAVLNLFRLYPSGSLTMQDLFTLKQEPWTSKAIEKIKEDVGDMKGKDAYCKKLGTDLYSRVDDAAYAFLIGSLPAYLLTLKNQFLGFEVEEKDCGRTHILWRELNSFLNSTSAVEELKVIAAFRTLKMCDFSEQALIV